MYLSDRNCPICNGNIEYDENNKILFCNCCKQQWLYKFYAICKNAYEENPQEYLNRIDSTNLP